MAPTSHRRRVGDSLYLIWSKVIGSAGRVHRSPDGVPSRARRTVNAGDSLNPWRFHAGRSAGLQARDACCDCYRRLAVEGVGPQWAWISAGRSPAEAAMRPSQPAV